LALQGYQVGGEFDGPATPPRSSKNVEDLMAQISVQAQALKHLFKPDGMSAEELMTQGACTYDDFLLLPGHIDFPVGAVDLTTSLTRNIKMKVRPLRRGV
jgi:hypothetical protein